MPYVNAGVHHATITDKDGNKSRIHLRVNPDAGLNLLWINGQAPPLLVDNVAAEFIAHIIEGMWLYQCQEGDESPKVIEHVLTSMSQHYPSVSKEILKKDLHKIYGLLMDLGRGACPRTLEIPQKKIKYDRWSAPARMDLALTYQCNINCSKCYVRNKQVTELNTNDWKKIIDKLWKEGSIPNLVFTGGEPTLRKDLIDS